MGYIEIRNYTKVIKHNKVLNNINLVLDKGKIYGFVGRNGSGKTMLFRAISGLIKATFGDISINNEIIRKDIDFPRSCGVILETPGFWDDMTGFECLKTIASIKQIVDSTVIREWMILFDLDPNDKKPFRKYSLGMKQKLSLIQALMEKPELLILDEPTNALDDISVIKLREILVREKERGATILLASHNKEDIELLCEQIFKLDNGGILDENTSEI